MPRKPAKRTAYFNFMKEKQDEIFKTKGIRVRMEALRDIVSADWNALTAAQKKVYEDRARVENEFASSDIGGPLASDGTSIAENIAKEEEQQQQKRLVELSVREYVMGGTEVGSEAFKQHVINQVHYVLAFNTLGRFDDRYLPCEIGLVEFSIKNGITKSYSKAIDHGPVPSGQRYTAMQHSESTHNLYMNDLVVKDDNYDLIWQDIISFINPFDEEFPPIFTLFDQDEQTIGSLQWLARQARVALEPQTFCIWSIAQYLFEVRAGCGQTHSLSSLAMAIDYMKDTSFDYTIGSSCDFHESEDSRHCALGYAKRNCYLIFSSVHKIFDIVLTEQHIPKHAVTVGHLFKPPERLEDAPSVPRPTRENGACGGKARGYDALEEFDDDDYAGLPSACASAGIGRGAIARSIPQSVNCTLPRDMARMNLGASGHSAGIGIGRGRPVSRS